MKRFICSTVLKAGRLARRYRRHLAELAVEAKSEKDLVSEADRAVERLIRARIGKRFPDCGRGVCSESRKRQTVANRPD